MTSVDIPTRASYRKPIGKRLRFSILERDGFRCVYCGAEASSSKLHVDHRFPVKRGGLNKDWNLATACADCNLGKSHKTLGPSRDETLAAKAIADLIDSGFPISVLVRGLRLVETANATLLQTVELIDHPDGLRDLATCEKNASERGAH